MDPDANWSFAHLALPKHRQNPSTILHGAPFGQAPLHNFDFSETIATAKATYAAAGQIPIVVTKEIDGFILNRRPCSCRRRSASSRTAT
jgi:hypothetical protein